MGKKLADRWRDWWYGPVFFRNDDVIARIGGGSAGPARVRKFLGTLAHHPMVVGIVAALVVAVAGVLLS